ncbi:MAG: Sir2 family NAD-dependent protein deacetylase [Bacteroidota bacterium]
MQKIAVLTGAGMSAESGLRTFRDADGLWEGHEVTKVATPEGWRADQELVLDFYNQRRRQLKSAKPNAGHLALVQLEEKYDVTIITQNVDDLHERAGSSNIIHLHGELTKVRSCTHPELVYDWTEDLNTGDFCQRGGQLRPHIVWFGEAVPMLEKAADIMTRVNRIIIIGTSMQVYPAASLTAYANRDIPIHYIDPHPSVNHELTLATSLEIIEAPATKGVPILVERLLAKG